MQTWLNAGDYDALWSEVTNINCEDMMNMTMDAAWQYFFTKFDVAIKRSVSLTSSKPNLRMFSQIKMLYD